MNDGLIGIERDVVLHTLTQDKSPIMVSPVVKAGAFVDSMTLQSTEYKIYPQGILFFKKFLTQWKAINDLLQTPEKVNIRMNISFYHRGRGLYFISSLNRVQNGYAVMIPSKVYKMLEDKERFHDEIFGKILLEGFSGVHAYCEQSATFPLFENKLWLSYSKKDYNQAKDLLFRLANLEEVSLEANCNDVVSKTKLLLYIPEKKIPKWNFFPFEVTITDDNIDYSMREKIAQEVKSCSHPLYIPLCENTDSKVHTILGLKEKMLLLTPSDVHDTLSLLSICKYLSKRNDRLLPKESTILTILGISDSSIVLGCSTLKKKFLSSTHSQDYDFPLLKGQEYVLQLSIPQGLMQRTITVKISVTQVYSNEKNHACSICRFLNLQEEDRRFLHEKYYGRRLR